MSDSADLFYVKLADGDVHRVSLDQLDEAFQAGHIDGGTMVLADGSTRWATLGELAGIDDDVAPVQVIPQKRASIPESVRPSRPPPPPSSVSTSTPRALPLQTPPAYRPQPAVPMTYPPAVRTAPIDAYMLKGPTANSVRPVSVDLGEFDPDEIAARRGGSGKRWAAVLLGLCVVGAAAGTAAVRPPWANPLLSPLGLGSQPVAAKSPASLPAAAEVAPPPVPVAPPAPPEVPAPAAAAPSAQAVVDSPLNPRFTDRSTPASKTGDIEKPKAKGHPKTVSAASAHAAGKPKSTTFTTGGNKFDPLNSSI